jgi:DNA (cytosine-5)-methyltransferase 1
MRSIELFAGAGGLGMGASSVGFLNAAVVEIDRDACATIRHNQERGVPLVKDWRLIESDISKLDFHKWEGAADLVTGGPPCQPFSIGGKHRGLSDHRNMFPQAVRVVREVRPRAFVFENVKGLVRESFAKYFSYILLQLNYPDLIQRPREDWVGHLGRLERLHTEGVEPDLRYRVAFRLLNAADYGVPQKRERVFIVGFRSDVMQAWSFPDATHSRTSLSVSQFLSGDYWERHAVAKRQRPKPNPSLALRLSQTELDGQEKRLPWLTIRDSIANLGEPSNDLASVRIPNHLLQSGAKVYPGHNGSPLDEPAKTLKAGDHGVPGGENMVRYPSGEVRYFTVRESCRLQTFPDEYIFDGSWTESMRQLGNAVPVTLARQVLRSVRDALLLSAKTN